MKFQNVTIAERANGAARRNGAVLRWPEGRGKERGEMTPAVNRSEDASLGVLRELERTITVALEPVDEEGQDMSQDELKTYLEDLRIALVEERARERAESSAELTRMRETLTGMDHRLVAMETRLSAGVVTPESCRLREGSVGKEISGIRKDLDEHKAATHSRISRLDGRFWGLLVATVLALLGATLSFVFTHISNDVPAPKTAVVEPTDKPDAGDPGLLADRMKD